MKGRVQEQGQLFYRFRLDDHVPEGHFLRRVDRFLDFKSLCAKLAPLYSHTGRLSVDPELMIRMLAADWLSYGILSETRLCEEGHLNLAYRWFCRLGLEGQIPERSTFSKNWHGRFAGGDILRQVFEIVVAICTDIRWAPDQSLSPSHAPADRIDVLRYAGGHGNDLGTQNGIQSFQVIAPTQ